VLKAFEVFICPNHSEYHSETYQKHRGSPYPHHFAYYAPYHAALTLLALSAGAKRTANTPLLLAIAAEVPRMRGTSGSPK